MTARHRHHRLAAVALLAIAIAAVTLTRLGGAARQDETATYCAGPAEARMLALINDFRAGRGLEPLALSRPLGAAAEFKSRDMATQGYVAHTSPDGVTPRQLLERFGYDHNTQIGENIAAGQEDAEATFQQWRESASHREIMLTEGFRAVGIGRAYDAESRFDWYWTTEFGGVLAEPPEECAASPVAAQSPPAPGTPISFTCDGVVRTDGTYDLTCRET